MKELLKKRGVRVGLAVIGALVILLASFQAGIMVGLRKARFAYQWGENYHRTFGGPKEGFFGGRGEEFGGRDFMPSHGIFGKILKIDGAVVAIAGEDGVERSLVIGADTVLRHGRQAAALGDLAVDDRVVVLGGPDAQGRILAKFVRVFSKDESGHGFAPPSRR
ncbi:MAG: hypothetical protein AAB692_00955 [Patescibacteria group bacterium]